MIEKYIVTGLYNKLNQFTPLGINWTLSGLGLDTYTCRFYGIPGQDLKKEPADDKRVTMSELSTSVGFDIPAKKIPVWFNVSCPPYRSVNASALAWGVDLILWYTLTYTTGFSVVAAILNGEPRRVLQEIHLEKRLRKNLYTGVVTS